MSRRHATGPPVSFNRKVPSPSSMTRVLRIGLLLFGIGFAVNACVAWTFALRPFLLVSRGAGGGFGGSGRRAPPGIGERIGVIPDVCETTLDRSVCRTAGDVLIRQGCNRPGLSSTPSCDELEFRSLIPRWSTLAHGHPALDPDQPHDSFTASVTEHAAGWPLLSFRRERIETMPKGISSIATIDHGAISLPPWVARQGFRTVLPVTPIWPEVIINSIFYAGLVYGLFLGPCIVRRRLRTKSDLCPRCAYPRGVSPLCTECGSTLPDRPVA